MTAEDIRNVTFETTRKGYVVEDVNEFLQEVAGLLEEKEAEIRRIQSEESAELQQAQKAQADAVAEKDALQKKMYILAQKVEEYREQEETIKTALINAQRMGETVVHEAKQKAEQIIREASGKGELLRQQAELEIQNEQKVLEKLHSEVEGFKTTMLTLYKQHIESLSALDDSVKSSQAVLEELRNFDSSKNEEYTPLRSAVEEEEEERTEEEAAVSSPRFMPIQPD